MARDYGGSLCDGIPYRRRPPRPPGHNSPGQMLIGGFRTNIRKQAVVSTVATVHPRKQLESFLFGFT